MKRSRASGDGINKVKGRASSSAVRPRRTRRTPGGKHAAAPNNGHTSTSALRSWDDSTPRLRNNHMKTVAVSETSEVTPEVHLTNLTRDQVSGSQRRLIHKLHKFIYAGE